MENISNFPCSVFSSLQNDCEMMHREPLSQENDEEHTFGSDFKKRARQTAIRNGAGKIQKNSKFPSSKLNISLRTFGNSIKSDLITKDIVSNLEDESAKSLCKEEILQLLEMAQQPQSAPGIGPKSIFRDIEEQYTQIVPSLASDEDIENCRPIGGEEVSFNDQQLCHLIHHNLHSSGVSSAPAAAPVNAPCAALKHVPSVQSLLEPEIQRLTNTYAGVNQVLAWEEMRQLLPESGTSDAHLRRNFRSRCNQLSAAQGRASPSLASRSAATTALQEVQNFCEEHERQERHVQQRRLLDNAPDTSPDSSEAPRCRTPDSTFRIFPETSYHTPENQRFSGEDLSARSTSRYQAGIFLVPDDYNVSRNLGGGDAPDCAKPRPVLYELQQTDDCSLDTDLNKNLMRQLGISASEQTRFFGLNDMETLGQKRPAGSSNAILNNMDTDEESHPLDNDLNETFLLLTQRPKKHLRLSDARVHTLSASKDSPDLPVLDALNFSRSVSPTRRKFVPRRKLHYVGQQLLQAEEDTVAAGDCLPLFGKTKLEEEVRSPFPRPVYSAADGRQLKLQFNMQVQKKAARHERPVFYSPNEYALRKRYAPHTLPAASEPVPPPPGAGPSRCEDVEMPKPRSPPNLQFFPRLHR